MLRIYARFMVVFVLLVLTIGGLSLGEEAGLPGGLDLEFQGSVGLEITFAPILPLDYSIASELALSFSVPDFTFTSETVFALVGFQSQELSVAVNLGAVQIANEILFRPTFSRNQLSVDLQIVGVEIGLDLILANIGTVQTPAYSAGMVLELGSGIISGFSITALTGFGAVDLVNKLGGINAPFSHELSGLFIHLDSLREIPADLEVLIVPGFHFEEQLVRLEMDYMGLISSSSLWLAGTGFSKAVIEFGYRSYEPPLAFLAAITFDETVTISGLDFIMDLQIEPVRFTSKTRFAERTPPALIPIVFQRQSFAVSMAIGDLAITSQTDFDGTFLFDRQRMALEAWIYPVRFTSLTEFNRTGFYGQSMRADVSFSGVTLYTTARFTHIGIEKVSFGFELNF